jgi:CRP-like cAMP-binding protein
MTHSVEPMTKTFRADACLFHENDRSRELYIVQSGKVKVYRTIGSREIQIAVLSKGAVLGEMALIDGKPRSASAKAIVDSSVIIIDADTFHSKVTGIPPWFLSIVRMASNKIRSANKHLERMEFDGRGINVILALHYCFCRAQAAPLELTTAQKQLSQLLGTNPHRVIYTLDFLQKNRFVEVGEEKITCSDRPRLEAYCTFLRLVNRKAYEKVAPLSEPAKKVVAALAQKIPFDAASEAKTTEVSAAEIESALAEAGSEQETAAALEALKQAGILTIKKSEHAEKPDNPLAGAVCHVSNTVLHHYALYSQFSNLVPGA